MGKNNEGASDKLAPFWGKKIKKSIKIDKKSFNKKTPETGVLNL